MVEQKWKFSGFLIFLPQAKVRVGIEPNDLEVFVLLLKWENEAFLFFFPVFFPIRFKQKSLIFYSEKIEYIEMVGYRPDF